MTENEPLSENHETGAKRSGDALGHDYWLITPIGLYQLAKGYQSYSRQVYERDIVEFNIDRFHRHIWDYLYGNRGKNNLVSAAIELCEMLVTLDTITERPYPKTNVSLFYANIPPIALRKLAETYSEGRIKYGEYNCELGFPISSLLNHAIKHVNDFYCDYINGITTSNEPDIPHALWNVLMAIHSEEKWPHLNKNLRGEKCELTDNIRAMIKERHGEKQ